MEKDNARIVRLSTDEKLDIVKALFQRKQDAFKAGKDAFKKTYPQVPDSMASTASFHIYTDGIYAVLDWLVSAELFLRESDDDFELYCETIHVLYHLYNYEQFRVLLPKGTPRVLEALKEIKDAISSDQDSEEALSILQELEDRFRGGLTYPQFSEDCI